MDADVDGLQPRPRTSRTALLTNIRDLWSLIAVVTNCLTLILLKYKCTAGKHNLRSLVAEDRRRHRHRSHRVLHSQEIQSSKSCSLQRFGLLPCWLFCALTAVSWPTGRCCRMPAAPHHLLPQVSSAAHNPSPGTPALFPGPGVILKLKPLMFLIKHTDTP